MAHERVLMRQMAPSSALEGETIVRRLKKNFINAHPSFEWEAMLRVGAVQQLPKPIFMTRYSFDGQTLRAC